MQNKIQIFKCEFYENVYFVDISPSQRYGSIEAIIYFFIISRIKRIIFQLEFLYVIEMKISYQFIKIIMKKIYC
jgi:hypothetical protein